MQIKHQKLDEKQVAIAIILENLAKKINQKYQNHNKLLSLLNKIYYKLFSKNNQKKLLKSVYLYGKVGRGKTMLMQHFFEKLNLQNKKLSIHFHNFIYQIHQNLHFIRKNKPPKASKNYNDELILALKKIIKNYRVICLDEFQVVDIADAMILSRVFKFIFSQNIIVVFTSNCHPKELYKNGLQREVFLEFVNKILLPNCQLLELDNNLDYRTIYSQNLAKRYFISSVVQKRLFQKIIENSVNCHNLQPKILTIWGRKTTLTKTFGNIAIIDFAEIININFAADDYREIAKNFSLIFFTNLPKLNESCLNEARKLTLFIDEIYNYRTALIILAKTKIDKIYAINEKSKWFERTISRLKEIQTDYYWQNSKITQESTII
jgi:cell division protein ZapE